MSAPIVIVGMGQLGAAFAEGFLQLGRPVIPVLRDGDLKATCKHYEPDAVLVATGEDDLVSVLRNVPTTHRDRLILIQNELRPDQWETCHIDDPSVAVVWFEKKKGKLPRVVLPSVLFGRHAALLARCLKKMDLPARVAVSKVELVHELILKNLYILGLNLTGLKVGGTAGDLLGEHRAVFEPLLNELMTLEETFLQQTENYSEVSLDEPKLRMDLRAAIESDPHHGCAGRSAPRRLERTLAHATALNLAVPKLTALREFV